MKIRYARVSIADQNLVLQIDTLEKEELLRPGYPSHEADKIAIRKAIQIYNEKRPYRSLNVLMPVTHIKQQGRSLSAGRKQIPGGSYIPKKHCY